MKMREYGLLSRILHEDVVLDPWHCSLYLTNFSTRVGVVPHLDRLERNREISRTNIEKCWNVQFV
jgi:hypothetical protein